MLQHQLMMMIRVAMVTEMTTGRQLVVMIMMMNLWAEQWRHGIIII